MPVPASVINRLHAFYNSVQLPEKAGDVGLTVAGKSFAEAHDDLKGLADFAAREFDPHLAGPEFSMRLSVPVADLTVGRSVSGMACFGRFGPTSENPEQEKLSRLTRPWDVAPVFFPSDDPRMQDARLVLQNNRLQLTAPNQLQMGALFGLHILLRSHPHFGTTFLAAADADRQVAFAEEMADNRYWNVLQTLSVVVPADVLRARVGLRPWPDAAHVIAALNADLAEWRLPARRGVSKSRPVRRLDSEAVLRKKVDQRLIKAYCDAYVEDMAAVLHFGARLLRESGLLTKSSEINARFGSASSLTTFSPAELRARATTLARIIDRDGVFERLPIDIQPGFVPDGQGSLAITGLTTQCDITMTLLASSALLFADQNRCRLELTYDPVARDVIIRQTRLQGESIPFARTLARIYRARGRV